MDGIGCGFGIDDVHVTVDRDAQLQVVHWRAAGPFAGSKFNSTRFHIADAGIKIPHAIVARIGVDCDGARMPERARYGKRQRHKYQCRRDGG
jgi:hypothetical protein